MLRLFASLTPKESSSLSITRFTAPNPHTPSQSDDTTAEPSFLYEPYILSTDDEEVAKLLSQELACPVLDELHPYLYLVSRMSSSHIDPLHEHLLKGRTVIITENPELHLVWRYKKLYVKPFPEYLYNFVFWEKYLSELERNSIQPSSRGAALGLARSSAYLVRHKSDFHIAQKNHLIPRDLPYREFRNRIEKFWNIRNDEVSLR
jgi:hypothetical protein